MNYGELCSSNVTQDDAVLKEIVTYLLEGDISVKYTQQQREGFFVAYVHRLFKAAVGEREIMLGAAEKIVELLEQYEQHNQNTSGFDLSHYKHMIAEMKKDMPLPKMGRWLGWLQAGACVSSGHKITIEDCKSINRGIDPKILDIKSGSTYKLPGNNIPVVVVADGRGMFGLMDSCFFHLDFDFNNKKVVIDHLNREGYSLVAEIFSDRTPFIWKKHHLVHGTRIKNQAGETAALCVVYEDFASFFKVVMDETKDEFHASEEHCVTWLNMGKWKPE